MQRFEFLAMTQILQTERLLFDKSEFLIDMVRHTNGGIYVEIIQTILNSRDGQSSIKLNSNVLTDIIKVLQNYHANIPKDPNSSYNHLTDIEQQKIQDRYLKGISIKDIAMQINQTEKLVEMILLNKGISVVPQNLPLNRFDPKRKIWYRK